MTSQALDEVRYERRRFWLTAVGGTGLFEPTAHGLEPQSPHTACYRGYVCHYSVVKGRLVLRKLDLGSAAEPPLLAGARAQPEEFCGWQYRGLDIAVAFTGRLLIGHGDIDDRPYLNMGFRPAWMFPEVRDLTFRAGALVTATDCSAELAAVRADVAATAAQPAAGEPTGDWISRTFSLTYAYSWPGRP